MRNLFHGLSAAAILAATALVSAQSTPATTRSLTRVPASIGPQGASFRRGCDLKDTPSCESAKRLGG